MVKYPIHNMTNKIENARNAALQVANTLAEVQNAISYARQNPTEVKRYEVECLLDRAILLRLEIESRMKQYDEAVKISERNNG
jgi:hypothetical protein